MAESLEDRKHPATALRRRRAKQEGLFPRSQEWSVALVWLVGVAILDFWGAYGLEVVSNWLADSLVEIPAGVGSLGDWYPRVWGWFLRVMLVGFPLMVGFFCVGLAVHFAQAGFEFRAERLAWNWGHMVAGLVGWRDAQVVKQLVSGVLKLFLVTGVVGASLWNRMGEVVGWSELPLERALGAAWGFLMGIGWWIGIGWLVLAGLDYGWNWWRYEKRIRMTDSEIREELRESQGDARMRTRRRRVLGVR